MNNTKQTKEPIEALCRRMFVKGLAAGLIPLLALVVLAGTLPYVQQGVDALFIDKAGNVGIGTDKPGAKLDVNGNIKTQDLTATGTVEANKFEGDGSSLKVGGNESLKTALDMKVDKTGGNITGPLTINGNVGIGTTAIDAGLEVKGTMKVLGSIQILHDEETPESPYQKYQEIKSGMASSDGFVVAVLSLFEQVEKDQQIKFWNGIFQLKGFVEKDLLGSASVIFRYGHDAQLPTNSFMIPVGKGKNWKINFLRIKPTPDEHRGRILIYWIPLGQ